MIFTSIWAKITAFMGVVIGGLLIALKLKSNKVDKLEEENKYLEVKEEIQVKQAEVKKEIIKDD